MPLLARCVALVWRCACVVYAKLGLFMSFLGLRSSFIFCGVCGFYIKPAMNVKSDEFLDT
jgi:hypothetical protein